MKHSDLSSGGVAPGERERAGGSAATEALPPLRVGSLIVTFTGIAIVYHDGEGCVGLEALFLDFQ